MFRKDYSTDPQRAQDRAVNTEEHLSKMSPSEIVDEMENIFLSDNSDDMDVDQLLAYLDHLDEVAPVAEPFDAEESYRQFAQDHAALMEAASEKPEKPVHRIPTVVRRIGLVAAALVVVVGVGSIAYASSTPFAQWVNETFSFNSRPAGEYTSLQEALDDYGVKDKLLPSWLPEEYVVSDISVNEMAAFTSFFAQYSSVLSSEHSLTIMIRENPLGTANTVHEKDSESVNPIEAGSNTFYVNRNFDKTSIIWEIGRYECNLSGAITEEDIFKIINSFE